MKYQKTCFYFSIILFVLFSSAIANGQSRIKKSDYNQLYKYVMDEYGFDQVLVNGFFYYDKYWKKEGHQFFLEDQLYRGSMVFRGKEYPGLNMKYDIFDQQIIFFIKVNNLLTGVIPPDDFISTFRLDEKSFSKYSFEGKPRFYQVIFDTDKLKCLYYWFKYMEETNPGGNSRYYSYEFTDSKRKSYLYLNGTFQQYRNNRTFTGLFPQNVRQRIKKYLQSNRIKVSSSSDERIKELFAYCQSLL